MKQKELEIFLQKVPSFDKPMPSLEQYQTPANIAAEMIFIAYSFEDIENKIVADLGCGTGILSVGAAIMGAKKVIGVDIDQNCIERAEEFRKNHSLEISFIVSDIRDVSLKVDTVIMNPPFGAQKGNINADRIFLEKSMDIASTIYSLHLTKTLNFIRQLVESKGREINFEKEYRFPIRRMFFFHNREVSYQYISLIRIV
ncbi:MAG: RNA methylase [Thermoplasmata archaeon]|nr:MAG: RNA methylase [Thermoplasmata archaeon]